MPDVVDLIMQDHREVERIFAELKNHPEKRPGLVPVLVNSADSPQSRGGGGGLSGCSGRGRGGRGRGAQPGGAPAWLTSCWPSWPRPIPSLRVSSSVLTELVEGVTHHVEEEESKVLPGMRERLSAERRDELGRAFAASRADHLGDEPDDIRKVRAQPTSREPGARRHVEDGQVAAQVRAEQARRRMTEPAGGVGAEGWSSSPVPPRGSAGPWPGVRPAGRPVALLARGNRGLEAAAAEVRGAGVQALAVSVDMSDARAVERAAGRVEEELGEIDVWVNVAFTSVFAQVHGHRARRVRPRHRRQLPRLRARHPRRPGPDAAARRAGPSSRSARRWPTAASRSSRRTAAPSTPSRGSTSRCAPSCCTTRATCT